MAITTAKILVRRGNLGDYDKTKLEAGEPVVILDSKEFEICIAPGVTIRAAKAEYLEELTEDCETYAGNASNSATLSATEATLSESYAVGDTGSRVGEATDNSKYYKEQAQAYKEFVENAIDLNIPTFTVDFTTGNLMYDGGMFVFTINNATGNLEYEVA